MIVATRSRQTSRRGLVTRLKVSLSAASLLVLTTTGAQSAAQPDTASNALSERQIEEAQRAAMRELDWMDGTWRGEAIVQTPRGRLTITQTERVGSRLGGTIKTVEGSGTNKDGTPAFGAFAVISFDAQTRKYAFRSYAHGRSGTFPIEVGEGVSVWETPAGPGAIMRYTIRLERGKWHEVGERIAAGKPATVLFEMTLGRVDPTSSR